MEIDIVAVPRRAALALDTATPALLPRARDPHFKSHDFSRVPVFDWSSDFNSDVPSVVVKHN